MELIKIIEPEDMSIRRGSLNLLPASKEDIDTISIIEKVEWIKREVGKYGLKSVIYISPVIAQNVGADSGESIEIIDITKKPYVRVDVKWTRGFVWSDIGANGSVQASRMTGIIRSHCVHSSCRTKIEGIRWCSSCKCEVPDSQIVFWSFLENRPMKKEDIIGEAYITINNRPVIIIDYEYGIRMKIIRGLVDKRDKATQIKDGCMRQVNLLKDDNQTDELIKMKNDFVDIVSRAEKFKLNCEDKIKKLIDLPNIYAEGMINILERDGWLKA